MRLVGLFLASCLASFILVACSNVAPVTPVAVTTANAAQSSTHLIASRNVQIPVTLTVPTDTSSAMPLVVMLHGHGGTRDEAGGFTQIAEELADAGIASVRMDFAGCGESSESFRNNRLSTMLADARAARDYAIDTVDVDTNRMGLMGFSMGGRLAITLANEDPRFHTLALWAPSASAGTSGLTNFFGGADALATAEARATSKGYTSFTTPWGDKQELSAGWFEDMEESKPRELIADYEGAVFVLYGDKDTVVKPEQAALVATEATQAYSAWSFELEGADHGLGLFSEEPELTQIAVSTTVDAIITGLLDTDEPREQRLGDLNVWK